MGAYTIAAIIAIVVYLAFSLAVGLGLGYKEETVSTSRGYFIGTGTQNFICFLLPLQHGFLQAFIRALWGLFIKMALDGLALVLGSYWSFLVWAYLALASGSYPRRITL